MARERKSDCESSCRHGGGKLKEKAEKERRKNNIIMFNVPESDKEEGKDREKDDQDTCERILSTF